jgi:PEP-CTERM motif
MLRRLLMACAGLALLQTQAFADSQNLGTLTMYLCDDGEDLCSNTLTSTPVILPFGPFTEDFVFNLVNDFPDVPNNFPLVRATATLETSAQEDFSSATNMLFNSSHEPIDLNTPFAPNGSTFQAQAETIIYAGTGLYVEVSGVSNTGNLPLQVSVNAFDLGGPIGTPEPSTWTMMLLGMAGLGFAARRRTGSALAIGKKASALN